jgi:hypothetical protein
MKFLVLQLTHPDFIGRLIKYFFYYFKNFLLENGNEVIIERIIDNNSNLNYWKNTNINTLKDKLSTIYKDIDYIIIFQYITNYPDFYEEFKKFKLIIINTEQTTNPNKRIKKTVEYLNEYTNYKLIDYNRENFLYFKNFINKKDYFVLEPNYSFIKDNHQKTIDIGIYNRETLHDKKFISLNLSNLINKTVNMKGKFNQKRLDFISKCKIFINIHAGRKYKIGETHRLNELIAHKCIVISQKCLNEDLIKLNKYIIFCDDDKIEETTLDVLKNYDKYYESIFNNQKNKLIFEEINKEYKFFLKI